MRNASEIRILTVEDDDFVREIIVAFLEDSGFKVLQAENGRRGLEIFRKEKPDLVLLDLRMPEVDGLEVLSTVTREAPEMPAIVVSGMGTIGDAIKALKLGAWDYLTKPIYDMAMLEHAVKRALERADLLRENRQYREHLEEEVKKRTSELVQRGLELEEAYKTLQEEVEYRRKAEETVNKINLELTMLSDCIHAVVRASDETDLIKEICRIIVEVGRYSMAWVGFAEQDEAKRINPVAAVGIEKEYLETVRMTWGNTETGCGPTGRAVRSGEPAINTDTRTNPEMSPWREEVLRLGYLSSVALPLAGAGKVFGALNIYAAEVDAFDHYEVQRLREVANDLAYGVIALRTREERNLAGVELQANLEKLQAALEGTVKVVASTVEVRDPYTAGHQKRVANLAKKIAEKMGLSPETVNGVYMAGLVHDLGKIYVPAEILSKPSLLADIEFNLIKTHPRVGFDLLNTIDFPWPIAQIVHQHHEKMNGSGYPAGLAGEEILLEARIITVADVVEAMGSHRPYRPSLGLDRALAQIREKRGILYDPRVVDVCLDLFATAEFSFE